MPRLSMNEMTTYRWSLDEDVAGCRAARVDGIGVWRRKLTEFGEERGADLLRESGLTVTSFWCAGGFTGSDGQTFRDAVDDALDALRLAAQVRADCLVVVTGSRGGHTYNHARRLVCDALVELGDAAGELGIEIALQPMHRTPVERWSLVTSLDATLDLLNRCNHSRVGLVFDLFHFWRDPALACQARDIARLTKVAALCDVRLPARNDDDRCLPGEGVVPLGEIIRTLEYAGFRGWYDLQILCEECWRSDYVRLIDDCRRGLEAACPEVFGPRVQAASPQATAPSVASGTELPVAAEPVPPF